MFLTLSHNAAFSLIIGLMTQIRPTSNPPSSSTPPLPPSSSSSTDDLEAQQVTDPEVVAQQNRNHNQFLLHWRHIIMEFCFNSALKTALLFEQTKSQLPLCFYLFSFAILLTFLCLYVANFIGPRFTNTAQLLEKIVVLLAATVVVFSITIPLPLTLKCVAGALYAFVLFTVLICQFLNVF